MSTGRSTLRASLLLLRSRRYVYVARAHGIATRRATAVSPGFLRNLTDVRVARRCGAGLEVIPFGNLVVSRSYGAGSHKCGQAELGRVPRDPFVRLAIPDLAMGPRVSLGPSGTRNSWCRRTRGIPPLRRSKRSARLWARLLSACGAAVDADETFGGEARSMALRPKLPVPYCVVRSAGPQALFWRMRRASHG